MLILKGVLIHLQHSVDITISTKYNGNYISYYISLHTLFHYYLFDLPNIQIITN